MHICDKISAFEFIPSIRNIDGVSVCHYDDVGQINGSVFESPTPTNKEAHGHVERNIMTSITAASTTEPRRIDIGAVPLTYCDNFGTKRWHPVEAERAMIYMLNTASNEDVFIDGLVTVEGFSKSKC